MSTQALGLILGGRLPALLFGLSNVFAKASNTAGISLGLYVVTIGLTVALVGGVLHMLQNGDSSFSGKGLLFAICVGLAWATGTACVAYALVQHSARISVLAPLFNMNSLVSVLLGMWLFAEWRDIDTPKLLGGALLIVIGGSLVASA